MKMLVLLFLLGDSPDAGSCFDNLCGMDSYCCCHRLFTPEYQGQARCYADRRQCEIDLGCCSKSGCMGAPARGQKCTDSVIEAVRPKPDGGVGR